MSALQTLLGKNVADNWETNTNKMVKIFQDLGCPRMSHKMHLLYKQKQHFKRYIGTFSEGTGERLHQEMMIIESRYGSHLTKNMLAEYIWSLKRDTNSFSSSRVVFNYYI